MDKKENYLLRIERALKKNLKKRKKFQRKINEKKMRKT